MIKFYSTVANKILDLFFPPKCAFCGEILTDKMPVCKECMHTLPFIKGRTCHYCGRELYEFSHHICSSCRIEKRYFKHSFVPLKYKESAKEAVLKLKGNHPYYAKAFAYLIADNLLSSPDFVAFDAITFVPQSKTRRFSRGYNHAELIAIELSKLLDVPCINTLAKIDTGKKQAKLNAVQRKENAKKSFLKGEGIFSGKVLLTDDIYTTGSTANQCAKLLRQMGFEEVYLAIATLRDREVFI